MRADNLNTHRQALSIQPRGNHRCRQPTGCRERDPLQHCGVGNLVPVRTLERVIVVCIVPVPAALTRQAKSMPLTTPKQPLRPVNVVSNDPRSTKSYSNFAVQLPPRANSAPPPAVHPILVTPLSLKSQRGQVLAAGLLQVGGTAIALGIALAEAELSTSIRPYARPPVPKNKRLGVANQPKRPRTVPSHGIRSVMEIDAAFAGRPPGTLAPAPLVKLAAKSRVPRWPVPWKSASTPNSNCRSANYNRPEHHQ
jgi:hypothetical protein